MQRWNLRKWLKTCVFDLIHPSHAIFCCCVDFKSSEGSFHWEWAFTGWLKFRGLRFFLWGYSKDEEFLFWSVYQALQSCRCGCWQGISFELKGFSSFLLLKVLLFTCFRVEAGWLFEGLFYPKVFAGFFGPECTWSSGFLQEPLKDTLWLKCLWLAQFFILSAFFNCPHVFAYTLLLIFRFIRVFFGHFL